MVTMDWAGLGFTYRLGLVGLHLWIGLHFMDWAGLGFTENTGHFPQATAATTGIIAEAEEPKSVEQSTATTSETHLVRPRRHPRVSPFRPPLARFRRRESDTYATRHPPRVGQRLLHTVAWFCKRL